jgi:hypothetical protein
MAPHMFFLLSETGDTCFLFCFMLCYKLETHLWSTTIIHIRNRKQKTCSIMINMFYIGMCAHRSVSVYVFSHFWLSIKLMIAGLQYSRIPFSQCPFLFLFFFFWSYALVFYMFRIGWISILGFKRALILLQYHLSSLLK